MLKLGVLYFTSQSIGFCLPTKPERHSMITFCCESKATNTPVEAEDEAPEECDEEAEIAVTPHPDWEGEEHHA